jgi:site-specific DNA-methyltransferase (adenine-specific)
MMDYLVGDCRDLLKGFPAGSFDCIVTDPPYGETNLGWDRRCQGWAKECSRVLKTTGSMWVFGSLRAFLHSTAEFEGWKLAQEVVWEKHNGSSFHADRFRRVHELAVQFYPASAAWAAVYKAPQYTADATPRAVRRKSRPEHWHGDRGDSVYVSEDGGPRLMRSVLRVRSEHGRAVHPTQKPLGVVLPLLRYSCPPGGHVLDPFAGSGTVGLAAAEAGMRATLVDTSGAYAAVFSNRLADALAAKLPTGAQHLI